MPERIIRKVDQIMLGSLNLITATMDMTAQFIRLRGTGELQNKLALVDSNLSALSEMPICSAVTFPWMADLLTPLGFRVVRGAVGFTVSGGEEFMQGHDFFIGLDDDIVCLTAGQFVDFGRLPQKKGSKLEELVRRTPSLVKRMSTDIAVLRGYRRDVDELGFFYITDQELSVLGIHEVHAPTS